MPRSVPAALLAALACLLLPAAARADDYVSGFSLAPADTDAGVHSQVGMHVGFGTDDPVRDLRISLPPGLVGDPRAVPTCSQADFANRACDPSTQVGTTSAAATATLVPGTIITPPVTIDATATGEVYNVTPDADEPARLGVILSALAGIGQVPPLPVKVSLRPDGGLDTTITDIPETVGGLPTVIKSMDLTLGDVAPSFMTTPTSCGKATTTIVATTRANVSHTATSSFTPVHCSAVPFTPGASIAVANTARTQPSGYTVGLTVPDGGSPRQSHVRRAQVTLPPGTTLSPGVASGLAACSGQQFGAPGAPAGCPAASQIGTVSFTTPLLGTLTGKAFFGTPAGGAYPLLVAVDQRGVRIKLTGMVTLDPATGRITTVFDNLPQVPFTAFALTFQGGDRAVLANPATCGSKALSATLTPWSGNAAKTATAAFTVTGCRVGGIPFRPTISVRSDSTAAGRPAGALSITIARPDGDQDISQVDTLLPPGLAASLNGVPMCQTAPLCGADSRLGSVTALVGSGGAPVMLAGDVFLTGPAEGGLAGLAIVLPGKVGPVDLGTVVVRAGLLLRPSDGGVTVRTAPLPALVGGVPVSVRSLTLRLDRPGFTLNPSSCAVQDVRADLTSAGGATATATAPYQATDCAGLGFAPRLAATLRARGPKGAKHRPAFTTILTVPAGQAATSSTHVTLPGRFGLDVGAIRGVCTLDQQAADTCPADSAVGTVTAQTPLLPVPLSGPVYLAAQAGQLLPGLRLALGGPVQLRLNGALSVTQPLVAAFDGIPDVPLSRLELTFTGGGPLKVLGDPCTGSLLRATGALTAHNGASATAPARVRLVGCPLRATGHRTRLDVHKGRDARRLKTLRITLPRGLHPKRLRATADGRRVRARVRGRTITLRLHRAAHVVVRAKRLRGPVVLRGTRVGGGHSTIRLRHVR